MICQSCGKEMVVGVDAKCADSCCIGDHDPDYVPENLGIGGGDYINFDLCLGCGQIQGKWPVEAWAYLPSLEGAA
jgi:hypothetical protein